MLTLIFYLQNDGTNAEVYITLTIDGTVRLHLRIFDKGGGDMDWTERMN